MRYHCQCRDADTGEVLSRHTYPGHASHRAARWALEGRSVDVLDADGQVLEHVPARDPRQIERARRPREAAPSGPSAADLAARWARECAPDDEPIWLDEYRTPWQLAGSEEAADYLRWYTDWAAGCAS